MASPFKRTKVETPVVLTPEQQEHLAPVELVKGGEVKSTEITEDQVHEHLRQMEEVALTYAGKEGFNPFLWRQEFLGPMMHEVQTNPSQELFRRILDISLTVEPKV